MKIITKTERIPVTKKVKKKYIYLGREFGWGPMGNKK